MVELAEAIERVTRYVGDDDGHESMNHIYQSAFPHMGFQADLRAILAALDMNGEAVRYRQALEDVTNPLGLLQRLADADGARLSGMAHSIANDLHYVQGIAAKALNGTVATISVDDVRLEEVRVDIMDAYQAGRTSMRDIFNECPTHGRFASAAPCCVNAIAALTGEQA